MGIPESEIFKAIFYEHYPIVRRKLTALVRDESAADDLAQEVFLRLYRNPQMIQQRWVPGFIESLLVLDMIIWTKKQGNGGCKINKNSYTKWGNHLLQERKS